MNYLFISKKKLGKYKRKISSIEAKKIIFKDYEDLLHKFSKVNLVRTDKIIIAGGDGTINLVVKAFLKKRKNLLPKMTFKILPIGTANDLYKYLGNGKKIQPIKINDEIILTAGGFGFFANSVSLQKKSRFVRLFGKYSYNLAIIKQVISCPKIEDILVGDKKINFPLSLIAIMNQPFLASKFQIVKKSNTPSISYLEYDSNLARRILQFFKIIKKKHFFENWFYSDKLGRTSIRFRKSIDLMVDGDVVYKGNNFEISLLKEKLDFSKY